MAQVFIIGGVSWDTIVYVSEFPQPVAQTLFASGQETLGSTGAGKALALTKLAIPTTLQAVLGNDEWGRKIENSLAQQGVNAYFDYDATGTERHVNLMNQHGERISLFTHASASEIAVQPVQFKELLREATHIVLNIMAYTKALIPQLQASGKPIWTDLHDYQAGNAYHEAFISAANYIFVSSDRLPNYREYMQQWIQDGKKLVVCTHGANGATAIDEEGNWYEQAVITTEIVDTNGAGDSFFAGFFSAYLAGKDIATSLQYGTICGALAVSSSNLTANDLSAERLEQHWQQHFGINES
ncbi:MAG: carbohydrate kinase family protein [Culicoidibacterales bacterium]